MVKQSLEFANKNNEVCTFYLVPGENAGCMSTKFKYPASNYISLLPKYNSPPNIGSQFFLLTALAALVSNNVDLYSGKIIKTTSYG